MPTPVSVDVDGRVLDVLQPYIDLTVEGTRRPARPPISRSPCCLGCTDVARTPRRTMLLVRMGLPGAADDLARMVYTKVKPLQLSLPSLADECPEWEWYEES